MLQESCELLWTICKIVNRQANKQASKQASKQSRPLNHPTLLILSAVSGPLGVSNPDYLMLRFIINDFGRRRG
jgi:hypothetical protein